MDGLRKKTLPAPPREQPVITDTFYEPPQQAEFRKAKENIKLNHEKKYRTGIKIKKFLKVALLALILVFASWILLLLTKTYFATQKMNEFNGSRSLAENIKAITSPLLPSNQLLKGQDQGRINILLLGAAGEKKPGGNLTDTIIVVSIDSKNKKVAMLSLPRDLYLPIPGQNKKQTKINTLYPIGIKQNEGINLIKSAVEEITSLTIHYYLAVDFEGFTRVIDDIGGINIIAERDIYDTRYPGPNYSYETFELAKGFHTLNGATALKYARVRHGDPEGDFGRAKRQQQIIQAVKNKVFSLETFFNVNRINDILSTLENNIRTDITFEEIDLFLKLARQLDTQNITNVVADAWQQDSLLKVSHVNLGNSRAFILIPRVGNFSEVQELAQSIFDQEQIKRRRQEIAKEDATITLINGSSDFQLTSKVRDLLKEKLGLKKVSIVKSAEKEHDITTIYDKTNGQKMFTLDELAKKLPAKLATETISNNTSDITVILGNDLVNAYMYEEASLEEFNKAQEEQANIDFQNINYN